MSEQEIPRLSVRVLQDLICNGYVPSLEGLAEILQLAVSGEELTDSQLEQQTLYEIRKGQNKEVYRSYEPFRRINRYLLLGQGLAVTALCLREGDQDTDLLWHSYSDLLALSCSLGSKEKLVGTVAIALPLQDRVLLIDLEGLDRQMFLSALEQKLALVNAVGTHFSRECSLQMFQESLGSSHIRSNKEALSLAGALQNFSALRGSMPCQMFLRSNHGGKCLVTSDEIKVARNVLRKHQIPYFTHSPYMINLSHPTPWALKQLCEDLTITHKLGGRGVVVHCGKSNSKKNGQISTKEALNQMEEAIQRCLKDASAECPLLLETSTGMGSETLWKYEALSKFYRRFEKDSRLRICIDTAHVHGAGYDPLRYLTLWIGRHGPESIGLVHLNDSEVERGAHLDRHAAIGRGYIGRNKLLEVIELCVQCGIPMVHE